MILDETSICPIKNTIFYVDHRIESPLDGHLLTQIPLIPFRQDLIRLLQRVRSWTWGSLEAGSLGFRRPCLVRIYTYFYHILYM